MDRGYIYLNKKSYLHNIEVLKNLSRKELCLVVKANAYGHGLEWAVKNAKESGVKWFAVASVDEGIEVKKIYGWKPKKKIHHILKDIYLWLCENKRLWKYFK